jgi:hypothetical protein
MKYIHSEETLEVPEGGTFANPILMFEESMGGTKRKQSRPGSRNSNQEAGDGTSKALETMGRQRLLWGCTEGGGVFGKMRRLLLDAINY